MASQNATQSKIKLLPDALANQIAAGEVIVRPASVVKELMENAVDAGARRIVVRAEEGGKRLIQVSDDGVGMDEVDARMCLERHATSKIAAPEDLWNIRTMGFRGEALPSIAAVARVEILTRTAEQSVGTRVVVEGGRFVRQESAVREPGTTVTVTQLFYYTPARKKFLRADHTEFGYIQEEFTRIALAHPHLGFTLIHNDEEIYHLLPGTLRQRIVQIFGRKWRKNLVEISEESPFGRLTGYVAHPDVPKTRRPKTYLYVNRRYVKHPHLAFAVRKAYMALKGESASPPFYVLFIEVAPDKVDVNIHPAKTEVKFHEEKALFSFIYSTIRQRVASAALGEQLMFDEEELQRAFEKLEVEKQRQAAAGASEAPPVPEETADAPPPPPKEEGLPLNDADGAAPAPRRHPITVIDEMAVVRLPQRAVLVDLRRAVEAVRFRRLSQAEGAPTASQSLLVPEFVNLLPEEIEVVRRLVPTLRQVGFDLDEFGELSFIIHAMPAELHGVASAQELFRKMVEKYWDSSVDDAAKPAHAIAAGWAEVTAARLSASDIEELLALLWTYPELERTPEGLRVFRTVGGADLRLLLDK